MRTGIAVIVHLMLTGVLEAEDSIHRYYDPATGQFLSVDPAVDVTGTPYAYVGGDPVNGTDPLGLGCGVFAAVCNTVARAWNDTGGKAVHYVAQHKTAVTEIAVGVVAVTAVVAITVATGGIADTVAIAAAGASEEVASAAAGESAVGLFGLTLPLDVAISLAPIGLVGLGGLGLAIYGAYQLISHHPTQSPNGKSHIKCS